MTKIDAEHLFWVGAGLAVWLAVGTAAGWLAAIAWEAMRDEPPWDPRFERNP